MTISKVGESRSFTTQHGTFISYKLELEGHGPAELVQKPETPAPQVGQSVFGELVPGREGFPPKLKKAQKQDGNWASKKRDPAEAKAIQRQHSQEMALRALDLAVKADVWRPTTGDKQGFWAMVRRTTDYFDQDIANGKAGE